MIFADEPTGNLDSKSSAEILDVHAPGGRRLRPDDRDGHARPDRRRATRTASCSSPTAKIVDEMREPDRRTTSSARCASSGTEVSPRRCGRSPSRGSSPTSCGSCSPAIAVMLGVAFVSGTLVLTATISRRSTICSPTSTRAPTCRCAASKVDASLRRRRTAPAGRLERPRHGACRRRGGGRRPGADVPYAQIVDKNGNEIGGRRGPAHVRVLVDRRSRPRIPSGSSRAARRPRRRPDRHRQGRGRQGRHRGRPSACRCSPARPSRSTRSSGSPSSVTADSALGASIVLFTLPEAQRIVGYTADSSARSAWSRPRASRRRSSAPRVADRRPRPTSRSDHRRGDHEGEPGRRRQVLKFFNRFLLVFALVALFVGLFIIYNTFSIVVAQRTREMALLRAIGASRRDR